MRSKIKISLCYIFASPFIYFFILRFIESFGYETTPLDISDFAALFTGVVSILFAHDKIKEFSLAGSSITMREIEKIEEKLEKNLRPVAVFSPSKMEFLINTFPDDVLQAALETSNNNYIFYLSEKPIYFEVRGNGTASFSVENEDTDMGICYKVRRTAGSSSKDEEIIFEAYFNK